MPAGPGRHLHDQVRLHPCVRLALRPPLPHHRRTAQGLTDTYEGDRLGQGKENSRNLLKDNPDLANEIEKKIKEELGIGIRFEGSAQQVSRGAADAAYTRNESPPSAVPINVAQSDRTDAAADGQPASAQKAEGLSSEATASRRALSSGL